MNQATTILTCSADVTAEAIGHALFNSTTAEMLRTSRSIGSIEIRVLPSVLKELQDILANAGDDPLRWLQRHSRRAHLSIRSEYRGSVLDVVVDRISLERHQEIRDFTGTISLRARVPETILDDVIGHRPARAFLAETSARLRLAPAELAKVAPALSKGVVLYGPPGTGKTMLARAFAGSAGIPIIATSGPELVKAGAIERLYRLARRHSPCCVFIDEADALGTRGSHSVLHDLAINEMLTQIQGFDDSAVIFHILATNRSEELDAALLRPGRLDRRFFIGALEGDEQQPLRRRILDAAGITMPTADAGLAPLVHGMTGAELEAIQRTILLRRRLPTDAPLPISAVREVCMDVRTGHVAEAYTGNVAAMRQVAIHEAGHAIAQALLIPDEPIGMLTIVSRGNSLGILTVNPDPQQPQTSERIRARLAVLLAGGEAERLTMGTNGMSMGSESDLRTATALAWKAVALTGLDPVFGSGSLAMFGGSLPESLCMAAWSRVSHWLDSARKDVAALLHHERGRLKRVTEALLESGSLSQHEIRQLIYPSDFPLHKGNNHEQFA